MRERVFLSNVSIHNCRNVKLTYRETPRAAGRTVEFQDEIKRNGGCIGKETSIEIPLIRTNMKCFFLYPVDNFIKPVEFLALLQILRIGI